MPGKRLPEMLGDYANRQPARFHMPGHKGLGMGGFFGDALIGWDVTELSFSDDLHDPADAILQAQRDCAKSCGAAHTFFLVNGATAGIHALLLALPQGARLLIGRDCHRAVPIGAALAGHIPSYVSPAMLEEDGMPGCVTPAALEAALRQAPADAVLITSPNYYGLCADLPALSAIAKQYGAKLFVDAAHGAHFPYSKALPPSPAGFADAWVHSAHKTLNAMGQAAMLHIGAGMEQAAVQRALSIVQTSSPSYLLLASLDWARYTAGRQDAWTGAVHACKTLAQRINRILGLRTLQPSRIGEAGIAALDPTRIVIDVCGRGITGYAARDALEERNIFVEFADHRRLVLICTPADDPHWHTRLLDALAQLPYGVDLSADTCTDAPADQSARVSAACPIPAQVLPAQEAMRAPATLRPLPQAAGQVAAGCVGAYPPGIPLWCPGERIEEQAVSLLLRQQAAGASLFGLQQGMVAVVANSF